MKPKVGTILTLEPSYSDSMEKYRCKVVEEKENLLYIDYPTDSITKRTVFLMEGAQLRASFVEDEKAAYAFQTEVLGRTKRQIPMIMLSFPKMEEVLKIQRREFVRVETPVDIAVEYQGDFSQFVAEDISAGGTAIILNNPVNFKEGDEIDLTVSLPFANGDVKYIQTKAMVTRFWEKDFIQIASVNFMETDDVDKQYIVRFCFERQLLKRKKEVE
ncbi:flagellar brake protein [Paenisporosarcina cavernae]|uniref:Glycosyltransferase n=1 Tax=Paenisporosarcina cavernae TaxID=2320858 RepID=A0A385YS93_9BACL|nr:flagellar brake domain-containing protein [Paenisporosarcina cavernae]AYC29374.1 glycosyltransferase [Paenisporosarcina cavernae]